MAEKKKKGRRSYLNDFKMNLTGEYIYTGAHFEPQGDYKKARLSVTLAGILLVALNLLCGCIPAEPMLNVFYVIIPFVVSLAASVRLLWAATRLWLNRLPLREYVLHQTFEKLFPAATVGLIFSALTSVAFVVFVAINGTTALTFWAYLFFGCNILTILANVFVRVCTKNIEWVKVG